MPHFLRVSRSLLVPVCCHVTCPHRYLFLITSSEMLIGVLYAATIFSRGMELLINRRMDRQRTRLFQPSNFLRKLFWRAPTTPPATPTTPTTPTPTTPTVGDNGGTPTGLEASIQVESERRYESDDEPLLAVVPN